MTMRGGCATGDVSRVERSRARSGKEGGVPLRIYDRSLQAANPKFRFTKSNYSISLCVASPRTNLTHLELRWTPPLDPHPRRQHPVDPVAPPTPPSGGASFAARCLLVRPPRAPKVPLIPSLIYPCQHLRPLWFCRSFVSAPSAFAERFKETRRPPA
jgi:hypothetical protein